VCNPPGNRRRLSRRTHEGRKAIPVSAKDEAEARSFAGKADAYDAALTALREETRR